MITPTLYHREQINWEQCHEMTQEVLDEYGPIPCEQCGSNPEFTLYRKKVFQGPWLCFDCNWEAGNGEGG